MAIHQVVVGARAGDAITQIAVNTRGILREFGPSEVYARFIDASVIGDVLELKHLGVMSSDDIVIWHASIGDEVVEDFLTTCAARLVVHYHNISPAVLYQAVDPDFADMLTRGRDDVLRFGARAVAIVTDSPYNADDLLDLGFPDVTVIPPILDLDRFRRTVGDTSFAAEIGRRVHGTMILSVGQILPHKRPEILISAHHLYTARHDPDATLVLAGHQPIAGYLQSLASWTSSLGLPRVWFTGGLTDAQVGELYRGADVYVNASEHEGFAVPVLEAMATSTPVITAVGGAMAETVGGAGIIVDPASPMGFCEAIDVAVDPRTRTRLALAGRARLREFDLAKLKAQIRSFYDDLA